MQACHDGWLSGVTLGMWVKQQKLHPPSLLLNSVSELAASRNMNTFWGSLFILFLQTFWEYFSKIEHFRGSSFHFHCSKFSENMCEELKRFICSETFPISLWNKTNCHHQTVFWNFGHSLTWLEFLARPRPTVCYQSLIFQRNWKRRPVFFEQLEREDETGSTILESLRSFANALVFCSLSFCCRSVASKLKSELLRSQLRWLWIS